MQGIGFIELSLYLVFMSAFAFLVYNIWKYIIKFFRDNI